MKFLFSISFIMKKQLKTQFLGGFINFMDFESGFYTEKFDISFFNNKK